MVGETSYICKEAGYVLHMLVAEPSEERMKIFPSSAECFIQGSRVDRTPIFLQSFDTPKFWFRLYIKGR